jgi:hypothetical protein
MRKTIIYLLVISFLLQSCYTYKTVELNNTQLVVGKEYKITQEYKTETAMLMDVNDSLVCVTDYKNEKGIPISSIKKMERRKPTFVTVIGEGLLAVAIVAGMIAWYGIVND